MFHLLPPFEDLGSEPVSWETINWKRGPGTGVSPTRHQLKFHPPKSSYPVKLIQNPLQISLHCRLPSKQGKCSAAALGGPFIPNSVAYGTNQSFNLLIILVFLTENRKPKTVLQAKAPPLNF